MAIFDILEDVSEKSVLKTETGDNRIFGVMVGRVTDNYDLMMTGRVCVSLPVRDGEANVLKWARVAMSAGGSDHGNYFLPEVGDQVLVAFEQGLIDRPYVIGCVQKKTDMFLRKVSDRYNQNKRIVTRHGNAIEFVDQATEAGDGDGNLDSIRIYTAGEMHQLTLDNARHRIVLGDKDNNAKITMGTGPEAGTIDVNATMKMTIKVGDNITIAMNKTGNISVTCTNVSINATGKVGISATGAMKLEAASLGASANGALDLTANGMAKLSGSMVKLG